MHARMDERTDGQTDRQKHDGHNAMTLARWPLASEAKNETLQCFLNPRALEIDSEHF